jgi:hypothetical protein
VKVRHLGCAFLSESPPHPGCNFLSSYLCAHLINDVDATPALTTTHYPLHHGSSTSRGSPFYRRRRRGLSSLCWIRSPTLDVLRDFDLVEERHTISIHPYLTKPASLFVNPQTTYAATQAPNTMAVPMSRVITSAYPVTSSIMTTPLVGSIYKVLTPLRLFATPTSDTTAAPPKTVAPSTTTKSGLITQMRGLTVRVFPLHLRHLHTSRTYSTAGSLLHQASIQPIQKCWHQITF